jgi:hypothetical protein
MDFEDNTRIISGFALVKTCSAYPEQYDVYRRGSKVGYFRLKHNVFRAYNVFTDEVIYCVSTKGDGCFEEDERDIHLDAAIAALRTDLDKKSK